MAVIFALYVAVERELLHHGKSKLLSARDQHPRRHRLLVPLSHEKLRGKIPGEHPEPGSDPAPGGEKRMARACIEALPFHLESIKRGERLEVEPDLLLGVACRHPGLCPGFQF